MQDPLEEGTGNIIEIDHAVAGIDMGGENADQRDDGADRLRQGEHRAEKDRENESRGERAGITAADSLPSGFLRLLCRVDIILTARFFGDFGIRIPVFKHKFTVKTGDDLGRYLPDTA